MDAASGCNGGICVIDSRLSLNMACGRSCGDNGSCSGTSCLLPCLFISGNDLLFHGSKCLRLCVVAPSLVVVGVVAVVFLDDARLLVPVDDDGITGKGCVVVVSSLPQS